MIQSKDLACGAFCFINLASSWCGSKCREDLLFFIFTRNRVDLHTLDVVAWLCETCSSVQVCLPMFIPGSLRQCGGACKVWFFYKTNYGPGPVHTSLCVRVAWDWWLGHLSRSPGTRGDWWSWPMGVKAEGILKVCPGESSNFRIT